jgi:hypothetical protein
VLSWAALQKSSLPSPGADALVDGSLSAAVSLLAAGVSAEPPQLTIPVAVQIAVSRANDQRPRSDALGVMGPPRM